MKYKEYKEFPIEKYKFYVYDKGDVKTVVAVSTYAGKKVRGVAKCDPNDTFDLELGKKLAAARCDHKVRCMRYEHSLNKLYDLQELASEIMREEEKAFQFMCDATGDKYESKDRLEKLELKLKG